MSLDLWVVPQCYSHSTTATKSPSVSGGASRRKGDINNMRHHDTTAPLPYKLLAWYSLTGSTGLKHQIIHSHSPVYCPYHCVVGPILCPKQCWWSRCLSHVLKSPSRVLPCHGRGKDGAHWSPHDLIIAVSFSNTLTRQPQTLGHSIFLLSPKM